MLLLQSGRWDSCVRLFHCSMKALQRETKCQDEWVNVVGVAIINQGPGEAGGHQCLLFTI